MYVYIRAYKYIHIHTTFISSLGMCNCSRLVLVHDTLTKRDYVYIKNCELYLCISFLLTLYASFLTRI